MTGARAGLCDLQMAEADACAREGGGGWLVKGGWGGGGSWGGEGGWGGRG